MSELGSRTLEELVIVNIIKKMRYLVGMILPAKSRHYAILRVHLH